MRDTHTHETNTSKRERRFTGQQPRYKTNARRSEWWKKPVQNQGCPKKDGQRKTKGQNRKLTSPGMWSLTAGGKTAIR